ncbi:hypothetical protein SMACR_01380 [Sordaria macrospora]|uniref:WGS project CABT00000000 data, contig 2.4 n=2 Tax=Sordaria macrospora TaxID=5147 RepID=F7VQN2_SORMK|nr:uncharacterized protein SMAC_01380 [Sordaria macrospora k-hell]KAA8633216.1 hypothetical protein SMACR_01380 [Sordaria macrospora]KAH7634467.1 hypothetical protein B0T09DRAFT_275328 [Sordaria sp. MPI-SDFR-AT-0083]WPJ58739.1 hypothetical protein SMAC4_01380 [Sordaria macrospora]CCC07814.1 unnamed protein product [Sordaria macrospora k-hell]
MSSSTAADEGKVWESRAHVPITVVTVVLGLASLAVGLRTYARAVVIRQFGMDDYAAITALIFAMGSGIMVASNTIYGAGHHMGDPSIDWSQLPKYFRTFYISIVLYNASLTAIKLTFLLQYYRVLGTRQMRKVVVYALVFVAMWSISQLLIVIFTCTPIEKFWLADSVPGKCMPNLPFWYINAAGNIVTDVLIFIIPLPALGSLNLRKNQKLALIGVFCLGFFTCAISIIRIQYLKLSDDTTWDNVDSSCWSVSELASGIVCSCLPTLRPLLARVIPSMGSHSAPSHAKYVHHSSGRDVTEGSSMGTKPKSGKFGGRSVVYPEDVELQTKADSQEELEKHAAVIAHSAVPVQPGHHHARTASKDQFNRSPSQNRGPGGHRIEEGGYVPPNQLGLQPTVRTEVMVGSQQQQSRWTRPVEGTISVKHDLVVTQDYN